MWDPLGGVDPERDDDVRVYRFDDEGIFRVRLHDDLQVGRARLEAVGREGTLLMIDWQGSSGSREQLPEMHWIVAPDPQAALEVARADLLVSRDLQRELIARGRTEFLWTEAHTLKADEDPAIIARNLTDRTFLPMSREPSELPRLRLIVPDGYFGAIWIIADPARGFDPSTTGGNCEIPDNGVLRVCMKGPLFRGLADPLVFDRSGKQWWLRRKHGNADGVHYLPIHEYLVYPDGGYRRPPDCAHGYIIKYLESLGETGLEATEKSAPNPFNILGAFEKPVSVSSGSCEECEECKKQALEKPEPK